MNSLLSRFLPTQFHQLSKSLQATPFLLFSRGVKVRASLRQRCEECYFGLIYYYFIYLIFIIDISYFILFSFYFFFL